MKPRHRTMHVTHATEAIAVLLELRRHQPFLFRGQRDRTWELGVKHKMDLSWRSSAKEKTREKEVDKKDANLKPIEWGMWSKEVDALDNSRTKENDGLDAYWKSKSVHKKVTRNLEQFIKHSDHARDARLVYPNDAPSLHAKSEQWWRHLFFAHHYGLNTLLLDWTTNPLVALYFAIEDSISDPEDGVRGAVYAIKVKGKAGQPDMLNKRWHSFDEVFHNFPLGEFCPFWIMINPPRTTDRIVRQSGKFSYHPSIYDEVLFDAKENTWGQAQGLYEEDEALIKIEIGRDGEPDPTEDIRRTLRIMNIHRASLFPDFDGIATYLNEEWNDMVAEDSDLNPTLSPTQCPGVHTARGLVRELFPG